MARKSARRSSWQLTIRWYFVKKLLALLAFSRYHRRRSQPESDLQSGRRSNQSLPATDNFRVRGNLPEIVASLRERSGLGRRTP